MKAVGREVTRDELANVYFAVCTHEGIAEVGCVF